MASGDIAPTDRIFSLIKPISHYSFLKKERNGTLVQMAMSNAQTTLHDQITLEVRQQSETQLALATLGELLNIPVPSRIEAFDISNIGGTHNVAGMVQFIEGKPQRKGYRKYKIQPMATSDDTAVHGAGCSASLCTVGFGKRPSAQFNFS